MNQNEKMKEQKTAMNNRAERIWVRRKDELLNKTSRVEYAFTVISNDNPRKLVVDTVTPTDECIDAALANGKIFKVYSNVNRPWETLCLLKRTNKNSRNSTINGKDNDQGH